MKDTGLRHLPFHGLAQNQIWLEIIALAADLLVWVGIPRRWPGTTSPPAVWNPNVSGSGCWLLAPAGRIRSGRRQRLRLPRGGPCNDIIDTGWAALQPG